VLAPPVLASGIASMDRDGRVREAAVRQLAAETDSLAGPFLILRTTDWVAPVAALAVSILSERLGKERPLLISSAPLALALSHRQRRSGVERIVLERAAVDAEVRAALLASSDRQTRRRVLSEEPVRAALTLDELTMLARSDPDTVVASTAGIEAVRKIGTARAAGEPLALLLAGPAPVRRVVLDALAERGEGGEVAERHLFARSPTVRAAAQRLHRRTGGDPVVVYRAALARGERVPIAIAELATAGQGTDHDAILGALRSADATTRRAAVGAVRWIARERLCELLAPFLWDASPSVTREAERHLRARASDLDGARIWELAAAQHEHQRHAAYRLLRRRTAPERIEADLIALAEEGERIRQDALDDLRSWLRRKSASAPRGDLATRRRLSRRLAATEDRLRDKEVEELRFHAALRPEDLES